MPCQFAFDFWRPVLCDLSFSFLFVFSVLINFSLFQSRRFYAADQTTDKTGGIMFSNCSSMCGACVHRWRHSLTGLPSTSTLFKLFYNWGAVRISTIIFAGILTEKYFLIYIFKPTSTKPQAGKLGYTCIQNYGCNGNLLCYHGVVERNRISSLQSHRKALEKECCLPGIFCDSGDTPANLLCELNGHLMPCTSCFYG